MSQRWQEPISLTVGAIQCNYITWRFSVEHVSCMLLHVSGSILGIHLFGHSQTVDIRIPKPV